MNQLTPQLSIRTPEGISFDLPLAGVTPRFLAWSVDLAAVMAINMTLGKFLFPLAALEPSLAMALQTLLYFVLSVGYGMCFEWIWRGQTPGKRLLRLRVVDLYGLRLQASQVAIRNLLRAVDMLPAFYFIGGAVCFANSRCQRLGDIAANTVVTRIPKTSTPDVEDVATGKYNSLRDYPHLATRLRQTITPMEASLALDALHRARRLNDQARIRVFDELAAHFQSIVEFPPEVTQVIGSEQYVRNVVDVIYRAKS